MDFDIDRKEALNTVKMYQANDWDIKEETPTYFLLSRNKQSLGIHLLLFVLFWWSLGLVNLAYYFLKKETKKVIK